MNDKIVYIVAYLIFTVVLLVVIWKERPTFGEPKTGDKPNFTGRGARVIPTSNKPIHPPPPPRGDKPYTINDLEKLVGEPIYLQSKNGFVEDSQWCLIVDENATYFELAGAKGGWFLVKKSNYYDLWIAFRKKPLGVEKWK